MEPEHINIDNSSTPIEQSNLNSSQGQSQIVAKKTDGQDGVTLLATAFTVEKARRALAEMVILDELPFRFVEGHGFRKFCNIMQPKFKNIPSRTTVAKDVLKIYNEERESLLRQLRGRRICLTTDTWTSIQNLNYMCLTCHFIDDDWVLHKRIMSFCLVEDHKGDTIGKKIESCLREWNIDGFFTLTVDNASSNSTAIKFLQRVTKDWKGTILGHEFLHMRCCAHILNLIVCDGLKEIHESILNIREAVRYVKSSPQRFLSFKKCLELLKIDSKSLLCLDVTTRWNSTYKMLQSAQKFEQAFDRMEYEDLKYRDYFIDNDKMPPTSLDWKNARCFVEFLSLFYFASKRFSGSLFVTSNMFFDEIFIIYAKIKELIGNEDSLLSSMASNMKIKFDKYWGSGDKVNLLLYIAVALDPRKKMTYLQFCFEDMYDAVVANALIAKVSETLNRLYAFYSSTENTCVESNIGDCTDGVAQVSKSSAHMDVNDPRKVVASRFHMFLEGKQSLGKSELDKYLDEIPDCGSDETFDILYWWKSNSDRFRVLSRLARDVLAIPISTVASESAFSTGGRVLDPFRSSLSPKMVEALICCQNWLRASIPISLRKAMDDLEEIERDLGDLELDISSSQESTLTQVDS